MDIDGDFLIAKPLIGPKFPPEYYEPVNQQVINKIEKLKNFSHDFDLSSQEWEKNKIHTQTRCVYKYCCIYKDENEIRCKTELGVNNFPRKKMGSLEMEPFMYCSKHKNK